jgi:HPt (histidine-containing phosphotransfer) domain-containing protein
MSAAHSSDEAQAPPAPWSSSNVLIDLERNGEWNFAKELIDTFLRDAASRIKSMRRAASAADMTALASCSHTLKGSAQLMNAVPLVELSTEIERCARLNERRDYLSLIDRLHLALAEVCQAMASYKQSLPQNRST